MFVPMRFDFKSLLSINPITLTACSILLVLGLFVLRVSILDLIELKTYDLRFLTRGPMSPSTAVVIAAIDEKSLDSEGRWPWPRSRIASLVDALSQDGAKVIGFDVGFLEADENSQLALIDQFSQKVEDIYGKHSQLTGFIEESKSRADNDLALAEAIKRSSADVVLGYFFHMDEADLDYSIEQGEIDKQTESISDSKYPIVLYQALDTDSIHFVKAYAPESNLRMFTDVAGSSGYFTLQSDQDGVLRWMPLAIQ